MLKGVAKVNKNGSCMRSQEVKTVKRAHFSISDISTDSDGSYSSQSEDEIIIWSVYFYYCDVKFVSNVS